jgi:hypothetical protein
MLFMNVIQTCFSCRTQALRQITHKLATALPTARVALAILSVLGLVFAAYKKWCSSINRRDKIEKKALPPTDPAVKIEIAVQDRLQGQPSSEIGTTAKVDVAVQQRAQAQTSSSTVGTDPITQMPFEPEDKIVTINNIQFSAETLAYYLVKSANDHSYKTPNGTEVSIWKTPAEYLGILEQLLPLITKPVSIEEIQMRLEGYPLAKALIQEFNQAHPTFSFSNLLECLYQQMHHRGNAQGANSMTNEQQDGFDAYYQLRSCLPEKIVKIIFPFYAYDPGDRQCIGSASRVLKKQIERLTLLGLNLAPAISPKEALDQKIKPYIRWFNEKFAPPALPTVTQTHWAGTITSEKAKQTAIDVTVSVTLHSITLGQEAEDGFAGALMEKFRRNQTLFLKIKHPISDLLQKELPETEKKQAMKSLLQNLISAPHDPLQRLKEICKLDREIFRSMREQLEGQLPSNPKDPDVWARIEKRPELISSSLEANKHLCLYLLIKQTLGIEIPASICWKGYSGSLVFTGPGDFPQVMHDLRDKSYKLLLSAE